jgi:3-mercaptopyruvate sulfurtransferase SseA
VTYCEVGVRAAAVAVLHEALTGREAAAYDGSLMEWGLDPALPVLAAPS